jgi:hypothetical protein
VIYWLAALRRIGTTQVQPRSTLAGRRSVARLRVVYPANLLLLAIFPLVCSLSIVRGDVDWRTGDPWIGLALYLFAVGEFIHYFVVKIVRSDHDRAARSRWHAARFRREVVR